MLQAVQGSVAPVATEPIAPFVAEAPVVEPPPFSVIEITETTPPIRGVGSGSKEAKLANGMTMKVSQLCDVGDKVRVDTETGEFKERVKR